MGRQKTEIIDNLQTKIVRRFINDKDFANFYEQYQNAKLIRSYATPTQEDLRIAKLGSEIGVVAAGRKLGLSAQAVDYKLTKVARYKYRTGK